MMKRGVNYLFALFLTIILVQNVFAVDEIKTYVTDNANVISPEYEEAIAYQLNLLRQNTSVEMAVVTIKSLNGLPIEEYSLNLAHENLGDEKKDNGILILLAVEDREYRIEVGYGLEGVINAALAGRVGREKMVPYFAESNYEEGLLSGVVTLKQILEGDDSWETESSAISDNSSQEKKKLILIIVMVVIWIVFSYISYASEKKNIQKTSDYFDAAAFAVWMLNNKGGRGGGGFGGGGFGGGGFGGGGFGGGGFSGKF